MLEIFYFENGVKKAFVDEIDELKDKLIWVDATNITKKESEILAKTFNLHPLTVEDLLSTRTRVKVEEFPNYFFCIFYGLVKSHLNKQKFVDTQELDFIIGNNFLISNHKREVQSFTSLKKELDKIDGLMEKGIDFLFHRLIDMEVDNFFPLLEDIDDSIERLEEQATKRPKPEIIRKILAIKRNIISIKRIVMPQREKIGYLTKTSNRFISEKAIPYFRDLYDHSVKVADSVEIIREAITSSFEVYMSTVSNNINSVMKILSVFATIALPLTVISSIYGTNFLFLPGGDYIYGFWVMIGGMIILSTILLIFFRIKKWI